MSALDGIKRMFHTAGSANDYPPATRNDDYSSYNARIVCKFQADIERLGDKADYESLRNTLKFAREINDYKVTPIGLMNHYTEQTESILADRK